MTGAAFPTETRIGWELHDIRVDLRTSSPEAAAYVRAHLGPAATDPHREPDLLIDSEWTWGAGPATAGSEAGERVGRYLRESDGRLRWSRVIGFDGLVMEAGRSGATTGVKASCRYVPRDALTRLRYMKPARREKKTNRTFFKMLYYALYFPVAWALESSRGWEILHASAVERNGKGLVLAGHGGAGKSTLALSMLTDPSVRFISDNLIFHDGESIYSLPEPVRLDGSSLESMRGGGYAPGPTDLPRSAHPKQTFRVAPERTAHSAAAGTVVLLRFTPESFLRPLRATEASAHLVGARDLVKEVEAYRAVAAFLSMATAGAPGGDGGPVALATTVALAEKADCYLVGIGPGEPVARTIERLGEIFP